VFRDFFGELRFTVTASKDLAIFCRKKFLEELGNTSAKNLKKRR
jgi:hypothetical protein